MLESVLANNPYFTIIIPTRNREDLLYQALSFVDNLEFLDYEVIVSDNGDIPLDKERFSCFFSKEKFHYKRPSSVLSMTPHWNFVIGEAKGKYVTVLNEKCILRRDFLDVIYRASGEGEYDIISWQYDHYDLVDEADYKGLYHPLNMPMLPKDYDPIETLKDKFSFEYPIFSRYRRNISNHGKVYCGFVKRGILLDIKKKVGDVFFYLIPDFSSSILILSLAEKCIDVNESLMLLIASDVASNGVKTRVSVDGMRSFIESYGYNLKSYAADLIYPGFWVGHHIHIATEYKKLQSIFSSDVLNDMKIDYDNLKFWLLWDLERISDWGGYKKEDFINLVGEVSDLKSKKLGLNCYNINLPCENEAYHSIKDKFELFEEGLLPEDLAISHWVQGKALPRKSIYKEGVSLEFAEEYLYRYNKKSKSILYGEDQ